ncbi:MAG TPA: serine hydrolase, partial [Puia sp.]
MKKMIVLGLVLFLSVDVVVAQSPNIQKLDSLFDVLAAKNLAKGTLALAKNGKVVYQRSVGEGAAANTEYRIGSITKMFTATLVFELLEEKRLSIDDRLAKYFPQLPNA